MRVHREYEGLPPIKVVGVGGGGCNAVNRMASDRNPGVQLIAVNTDAQALANLQSDMQIRIGDKLTKGLGAGGDPARGQRAAEESRDELKEVLRDAEMVFVTAGMGGGTGTGAAPVIAQVAKECGALTIGVVTRPFSWEGTRRGQRAEDGIMALRDKVDTLIIIPNDRLTQLCDPKAPLEESFRMADEVLRQGIQGISEVITLPGIVNLDFADVRRIMSEAGPALLAIGRGRGDNRAADAARAAVTSPLLEISIEGARGVLFNVVGKNLTLGEINQAAEVISSVVSRDAEIVFGAAIDPDLGDEVKVTVIATGFDPTLEARIVDGREAEPAPQQQLQEAAEATLPTFERPRVSPRTNDGLPALDTELPTFLRRSVPAR